MQHPHYFVARTALIESSPRSPSRARSRMAAEISEGSEYSILTTSFARPSIINTVITAQVDTIATVIFQVLRVVLIKVMGRKQDRSPIASKNPDVHVSAAHSSFGIMINKLSGSCSRTQGKP